MEAEHHDIVPGDCVTLKSGCGPTMCVTNVENPEGEAIVTTIWFTCEGLKQKDDFPKSVLMCAGHHDAKKTKAKK